MMATEENIAAGDGFGIGFGFNGKFTINGQNGHRTFRIKTAKGGALKGKRILGLLTGPENTTDYEGFAFVDEASGTIRVWRSKQGGNFDLLARMLASLLKGERELVGKGYSLLVEKKCCKCNRTLTDPTSIRLGIGPECRARSGL